VASGRARRVSHLQPDLEKVTMGKSRIIEWLSPTGESLRGALLLPPGLPAGIRVPLVVWVYGGSYGSEAVNQFGFGWGTTFNMQMLATRGYAVLFPDVPLHDGRPVQDVIDAVLSGVNRAVELGIADPERLAVMGQSFGGYNTQSLITHTTRFKAAIITGSATANLFEGYPRFESGMDVGTGYYERGQGGMRVTPWEMPLRYIDNSPSFLFDRVQTPLLIVHGTSDWISSGSTSTYNSLRRLGKAAQLLEYDGEGHVIQNPLNVIDLWHRRMAWLARYVVNPASSSQAAAH
jgi:dipeptidyl aminopeptidase/acylaminoacyl peptidase